MLFRRFYDDALAQASYLVGCQRTGEAIVVDPNRDVEHYLAAAKAEGARITHVTETHVYADFVSGARELARRAGARLSLSAEGPPEWKYRFAEAEGARLLRDGDSIEVGDVRLDIVHTPGHTPEHLSFVVTDTAGATGPMGLLSGDFLFVGDVGRPDLLERAAGERGTAESLARQMFHSLRRISELPDWLQLWPGHGAGSACGKSLGAVPQSTLGYERRYNWAFGIDDENEFVVAALDGLTQPPRYFARMKRVNRDGPAPLRDPAALPQLDASALAAARADGAVALDTRSTGDFAKGHLVGAIAIPAGASVLKWTGALLDGDQKLVLVATDATAARRTALQLAMIGFDQVMGFASADDARALAAREGEQRVERVSPTELARRMDGDDAYVLDVRAPHEWAAGHLPGVPNLQLPEIPEQLETLPRDTPIILQCQSGTRSIIAASLLQAAGFERVADLEGGYKGWVAAGEPVQHGATAGSARD
ncbi:MAG: MBL fold metallo-hydrolase [Gemmatimonadaceae bacterium]|nr:MBL fold metallo-hydrolase [Gemmatimonadaceae bacterium]NUR18604.1 MBL fold metallo-hydrolase [Gemmatimonadaceae bacterium]